MSDVEGIMNAAEDVLTQAKSGNVDISKVLQDVQTIVSDVKQAKSDCNLGLGLQTGGFEECLNDVHGVVSAVQDILSQLKSGNPDFAKLLEDAEAVEKDVVAAETDCKLSFRPKRFKITSAGSCISDIEDLAKNAMDILAQVKSGSPDMSKILQDATQIASDATSARADCKLRVKKISKIEAKGSCEQDV